MEVFNLASLTSKEKNGIRLVVKAIHLYYSKPENQKPKKSKKIS